ncbi:MAG: phenylacetate--CoA ligase, partial [Candidatus Methanosuratincola petrocarbonis]
MAFTSSDGFFQPEIERMGREEIEKLQKKKLKAAIKRAERIPFLRERLREKRIGEISALSDVSKLPFTIKKD